jgi:hypothetical protein
MRSLSRQFVTLCSTLNNQQQYLDQTDSARSDGAGHAWGADRGINVIAPQLIAAQQSDQGESVAGDRQSALERAATIGLVFLDLDVPDYASLAAAVRPGYHVILMQPGLDPIGQISAALAQYQQLSSLHLIGHGAPGQLNWSAHVTDQAAIEDQRFSIQQWSLALAADATILLYGCEVGAGRSGAALIERLSQLTGAQVAASSTRVGQAAQGGNWQLDVCTGNPDAVVLAFDAATLQAYSGVLFNPIIQLDSFADSNFFSLNGNARQVGGALQLTDNQTLQRGSSFYVTPLQIVSI